ncbi:hypothetical protein CVD28_17150 [Bacillus sp. M6-12]|uniref:hypothetical protein n=1 Tax=Bacillus sp. M6-12 TaxID=2054166 RepID=UPI000C78DB9B|nr:hypothetical protein [Bacillus sp. M6-12]PLS16796.1 hypothetical protein CVD28_17150 [Bacillus sp. M6-12]
MDKVTLFNYLQKASKGNFFSTEIPAGTIKESIAIKELVEELEKEGKIKVREFIQREYSVYIHGIIKYASE